MMNSANVYCNLGILLSVCLNSFYRWLSGGLIILITILICVNPLVRNLHKLFSIVLSHFYAITRHHLVGRVPLGVGGVSVLVAVVVSAGQVPDGGHGHHGLVPVRVQVLVDLQDVDPPLQVPQRGQQPRPLGEHLGDDRGDCLASNKGNLLLVMYKLWIECLHCVMMCEFSDTTMTQFIDI